MISNVSRDGGRAIIFIDKPSGVYSIVDQGEIRRLEWSVEYDLGPRRSDAPIVIDVVKFRFYEDRSAKPADQWVYELDPHDVSPEQFEDDLGNLIGKRNAGDVVAEARSDIWPIQEEERVSEGTRPAKYIFP